jgi:hypothetical protein
MNGVVRAFLVVLPFAAGCAVAPRLDSGPVPLARAHGLLFVELTSADGPPLLALLDTGANASAIDEARGADLAVLDTTQVVGTTGTLEAELVEVGGLWLGRLALPALRATRRSLGGLLSPDARRVDMILGTDALAGLSLTIDFARAELCVRAPRAGSSDGVPLGIDNGIPTLAAEVHGERAELRIDTGASLFATEDVYVNVPEPLWAKLRARDPALAPERHFQGTGAGGRTVILPVARVGGVRIGPSEFPSAWVIVQPEAGYFAQPDAKGFVGNNYLEKLGRVTIDLANRRFVARP